MVPMVSSVFVAVPIRYTLVIVVSTVPLVSLVSIAVFVRCFSDHSACSASGVLGVCSVSVRYFGDHSACSAW